MKTFRKKTGKKKGQFTQPDEFQSLTRWVLDYVQMNAKKVYIVLGAIAVVLVVGVAVSMLMASSRAKLAARQAEALRYYDLNSPVPGKKPMSDAERMQKAIQLFSEVAKSGGSGPVGRTSLYYKANAEMDLGEYDAAIKDYKEVTSEAAGNDKLLMSLADIRLAAAYAAKGDKQGAMEAYMSIIKTDGAYLKDEAHFQLGGIYEGSGQKDRAVHEYRTIVKEFQHSPWAPEANKRADALEGKAQPAAAAPMQQGSAETVQVPAAAKTAQARPAPKGE